jgi:hypothetical protein
LLSTLTFESNSKLDRIEALSFSNCSSLTSISIPSSVTFLGNSCFSNCRLLSTLIFESNCQLDRIESGAFHGCLSLKLISVPSSVRFFGEGWFIG